VEQLKCSVKSIGLMKRNESYLNKLKKLKTAIVRIRQNMRLKSRSFKVN